MLPVKLVFVDDDPDDREMIQGQLMALGTDDFLVLESSCALLNYLGPLPEKDLPEAIVLDWNMPKMDGLEILKHLKSVEDYQLIPVFMLTTSARPDLKRTCIREGAAGFYTKPNTVVELKALLSEIYNAV